MLISIRNDYTNYTCSIELLKKDRKSIFKHTYIGYDVTVVDLHVELFYFRECLSFPCPTLSYTVVIGPSSP